MKGEKGWTPGRAAGMIPVFYMCCYGYCCGYCCSYCCGYCCGYCNNPTKNKTQRDGCFLPIIKILLWGRRLAVMSYTSIAST